MAQVSYIIIMKYKISPKQSTDYKLTHSILYLKGLYLPCFQVSFFL